MCTKYLASLTLFDLIILIISGKKYDYEIPHNAFFSILPVSFSFSSPNFVYSLHYFLLRPSAVWARYHVSNPHNVTGKIICLIFRNASYSGGPGLKSQP
jgi:hypothetical protein